MPERLPPPDRLRIEALINSRRFAMVPDSAVRAALRSDKATLQLDQLDDAAVVKASLHSEETAEPALRHIVSDETRQAIDQKVKKLSRQSGTGERLWFQLISAAMAEVQSAEDINISAQAIAALVDTLDKYETVSKLKQPEREQGSVNDELLRQRKRLIEQVGRGIQTVTTLPPELSNPQFYAVLMHEVQSHLQAGATVKSLSAMAIGLEVRDRMCRTWKGKDYDGYATEEYRSSALLFSPDKTVRATLLNDESIFVEGFRKHRIWLDYMQQFPTPDTGVADYPLALMDPQHPRHQEARHIFRLFLSATHTRESMPYALNMAAFGADVTESKQGTELMRGLGQRSTLNRLPTMDSYYQGIFGPAAKGIMDKSRIALMGALAGGTTSDWRNSIPQLRRSPEIKITTTEDSHGRMEWRAVNTVQPDDERTRDLIPELTPEQETALTTLADALAADIQETTIALPTLVTSDTQRTLLVQPIPDQFPAINLEAATEEILTQVKLDERLAVVLPNDAPRARQLTTALRAIALAVLHDRVLAVQRVQVGEARTPAPTKESTAKPTTTRVHKARNFIVIGERAEDEQTVQHTIQEDAANHETVMLMVDRRPHWSDRAPQLTMEARRYALQQWLEEFGEEANTYVAIISQALTQEGAHRLTVRRILEGLMQQERSGQKLLPPNFPLHQAIERLTELADERYHTLLNDYVGEEEAAGPLPNVYKMSDRMEADRAKMAELGVEPMSMPPRLRETETYMPFSRYETPVKLGKLGQGKVRHYTVMRGTSASDAVQRILNS